MNVPAPSSTLAEIGVIGGTGLYSFLTDPTEVAISTPYGEPSDRLVVGAIGGRQVAFVPRHGKDHRHPPHRVNYRANLWALRSLGVHQVLGPCAVGSLRQELGPGSLVVPDQLIDRTTSRAQTFYDSGGPVHVTFADPYCPTGRAAAVKAARDSGWEATDSGTMVVIEGPRFSTRAESQWYANQGWSLVNMTGHPEAVLARELALCYTSIALVTDVDAGLVEGEGVSQDEVFATFAAHVDRLRDLLYAIVPALPAERTCPCPRALDGVDMPIELPE
jgi:5'-methylthioadenosine phosphorylase